jgi:parvulin-like peptidyl-prolyl isomerase
MSLLGAALVFSAPVSVGAQSSAQDKLAALFGNEVIARGEGFEIDRATLDESVVTIRSSAAGRGNDISRAGMQRLEQEVLRRLINIELLAQRATDEDRVRGEEKAEERISALTERAGSSESMQRQLTAVGLSLDRLRSKLVREATSEMVLERELDIQITDDQIKTYYDENPARFEKPEEVRLAHILLRTSDPTTQQEYPEAEKERRQRKMESLLKRARRGEDFAALADEFTEDLTSKGNGGEFTIRRGRTVPEFEAAAFSLPPGQISDVVTTVYGFHIIKVHEKLPARTLELDEEVAEEVRAFLKSQELQKQMEPFMETLRKEANVEILDDRLTPQPGDEAGAVGP